MSKLQPIINTFRFPLFPPLVGRPDPGDSVYEADPEPPGRLHRLLLPRLRVRPLALPAQQPACGQGRHQAEDDVAIQVKQPGRIGGRNGNGAAAGAAAAEADVGGRGQQRAAAAAAAATAATRGGSDGRGRRAQPGGLGQAGQGHTSRQSGEGKYSSSSDVRFECHYGRSAVESQSREAGKESFGVTTTF